MGITYRDSYERATGCLQGVLMWLTWLLNVLLRGLDGLLGLWGFLPLSQR